MAGTSVDIVPFAARIVRERPGEAALWWEDPRDIHRVQVTFAKGVAAERLPELHYWRQNWPKVRVPRNARVGAGDQGWWPMDDWITGQWQQAATTSEGDGRNWTYTFRPLDAEQIPDANLFPVSFRRTLKLGLYGETSLPGIASLPGIETIAVFTDSEWREIKLCLQWGGNATNESRWDGRLEAFNGYVLGVEPLDDHCQVAADGSWRSVVCGNVAGIVARVRYAWNEDRNSFDRTILTLRAEAQPSFSISVNDLVTGEQVYVPDWGVAVGCAESYPGLAAVRSKWEAGRSKTVFARVEQLPEQTWERAWSEMPRKGRFYFVLGCEGARQKFRLEPNGDLLLPQNYIRKVQGKDSDRLLWEGDHLAYRFGLPEPATRELLDGYLPIMRTNWPTSPIAYLQEALATWLIPDSLSESERQGDDPVVALLHWQLTNVGREQEVARICIQTADADGDEALSVEGANIYATRRAGRRMRLALDTGGRGILRCEGSAVIYELILAPGAQHSIVVKVPFITLAAAPELAALGTLLFDEQREAVASYWRSRVGQGMQIDTPNVELNLFHRAHLIHMLIANDREPGSDRCAPRCGGFHYGVFPDEAIMGVSDLDRRGYTKEAQRCLEMLVHYQGTVPLPGDLQTQDGVLYGANGYECGGYNRGQGWAMWGLAEHYRYTRDRAWLERVAPAMIRACDWVTRERRRTMVLSPDGRRLVDYGFLPAGSLEDVTDYWHWLSSNAYASWGFSAVASALDDADYPEAPRLLAEGAAFRRDLMSGFSESRARSPLARLADGRYVPYYPPRLERRGRDFGWLREVLEGAMGLLVSEMVPLSDPAAQWIIDDYEDNLYLSEQYGYANSVPDSEGYWFSRGGFSMQSNLLLHPAIYLRRDNVKPFLRAFFNGFASTYYPETCMLAEHALPTLADARGDHFKTSDEANVTHYLRLMLIEEHGWDLVLGKAIPRAWLMHGKTVRVQRALTYFGEMSYTLHSRADEGLIEAEVELPQRNPPARAWLRLRHPRQESLRRVEMDGESWPSFDAASETIGLPPDQASCRLVAFYR
jgi:hypothetical protein